MNLRRLYRLTEAGVENDPAGKTVINRRKVGLPPRRKRTFGHEIGTINPFGIDGSEVDDLGPDVDYDDPSPPEQDVKPAKPFKEPEKKDKEQPFTSTSAKPSAQLQGGKSAGSIKADAKTLDALERALENVRTGDDDLQSWIDDLLSEIGRAARHGGDVTLPKFVAASDDDVEDDGSEDED